MKEKNVSLNLNEKVANGKSRAQFHRYIKNKAKSFY